MRTTLTGVLLATLIASLVSTASPVVASPLEATSVMKAPHPDHSKWRGPCDGTVNGEDDTGTTPAFIRHRHVRNLVVCVFTFVFNGPSQVNTALYVAERESGFEASAYNPSGCAGVFQHMRSLWAPRSHLIPHKWLSPYLWTRWSYGGVTTASPFNPYVNVWAAARMVKSGGWGPWSL